MGPLASIPRSSLRRTRFNAIPRWAALWLAAAMAGHAAGARAAPDDDASASTQAPPPAPATPVEEALEHPRYRLDPIVVTAERSPVRLNRIPSDVTVIGRGRLERERPFFLAEALRDAPGIDVQRSGSLGKVTDVRLRGADPRHTLVLFDGIPLNGPWLGSFDFADLDASGVDRVEVLGGPASALYGSGAVGGVIQILSATAPPERKATVFADFGQDRTFRQGAAWRGAAGSGSAGLTLGRLTSEGRTARDGYEGVNGKLHLEIPVGSERLRVSVLGTQGRKELPYDFTFDFSDPSLPAARQVRDPNIHEKDRVFAAGALYTRDLPGRAAVEAEVTGFAGQIEYEDPPDPPSTTDTERTQLDNTRGILSLRARIEPAAWIQALAGGEYRTEGVNRLDESNFGGSESVTDVVEDVRSRALYAQTHVEWRSRVLFDSGIRLEDHSRFGAYGVPRVALGILFEETGLKLRGGYGRAFNAPTLTDLFFPGYGSPTLKPERSRTWEAGVDGSWLAGTLTAKATWYETRFRDLIQSNSFFVADNVGRARIEGEEYAVRVSPSGRLSVEARAAHLIGKNLLTGERLAKRPAWRAGLDLHAEPAPGLTTIAGFRWSGAMRDPFAFVDAEGHVLDGDTPERAVLDLGLNASLNRWIPADVRLRLENALDRRNFDVKGFPARGRAFSAGVTWST